MSDDQRRRDRQVDFTIELERSMAVGHVDEHLVRAAEAAYLDYISSWQAGDLYTALARAKEMLRKQRYP